MRVSISYPPLEMSEGIPLLSQNRQFQWFSEPTYIYPMVPAYAATLLSEADYEIIWDDAIAEEKTYDEWLDEVEKSNPDLMMIETKTPVVKKHWSIIEDVKKVSPDTKVAFVGDHVTALPEESMINSGADFILTGGDYDFLLLNLVEYLNDRSEVLEAGIWYRKYGDIKSTGNFVLNHDLNVLPLIDRDLTKWHLYAYKNGNFKMTPGTYTMVGRDCWWHKCTFCSWTILYPKYRVRTPLSLVNEIGELIESYHVKEIFDDTGTFPTGGWLKEFCELMIERGYNNNISIGCNMRFGACSIDDYRRMKQAGFRMLLFGLESANQETLDRINKNVDINQINISCKNAKLAHLEPHITIMVGYPWETKVDAYNTLSFAKKLFVQGFADTLQATIVIPYPGTPLFRECKSSGLLLTEDWDEYDMKKLIMKTQLLEEDVKTITQELYKLFFNPKYILRKIKGIKNINDVVYVIKGLYKIGGHIMDFSTNS